MGLFKDKITGWFSPIPIDEGANFKSNLKSISNSIRLIIEVNNSELTTYTGYLIALFSIFVPIYIALLNFNLSFWSYIIVIELNAIGCVFLIRKIKLIKEGNEMMIEQYNVIQAELGGVSLVKMKGKKEEIIKQVNEWNKNFNFKPIKPKRIDYKKS